MASIPLIINDLPFDLKRLQFALKVGFAMILNKYLKYGGIDLRGDCFFHGQFYVVCSRVSLPMNLLYSFHPIGHTKVV